MAASPMDLNLAAVYLAADHSMSVGLVALGVKIVEKKQPKLDEDVIMTSMLAADSLTSSLLLAALMAKLSAAGLILSSKAVGLMKPCWPMTVSEKAPR